MGCRDQVLTHLALLRSALQAWGSGPSGCVFCLCRAGACVSGLKGRFLVAQGAALGPEPPQKTGFLGLKGRFQGVRIFAVMYGVRGAYARGSAETGPSGVVEILGCRDHVLTHLALLRSALQAWWGVWGGRDQVLTHLALLRSALQA